MNRRRFSPVHARRRRLPEGALMPTVRAGAALLLLTATGCLIPDFSHLTDVGYHAPTTAQCGECHADVYNEWRTSPHAGSYTSPAFVAATAGREFARCLPCHAPNSVFNDGPPLVRGKGRDEGVSCIACHLRDARMAGPVATSAALLPHPVLTDESYYRSSALCGTCHIGTFRETQATAKAPACQTCHMPPVRRKNTQASDKVSAILVAIEDEVDGRRHGFDLRQMDTPDDALVLELTPQAAPPAPAVTVHIRSGLPHSLPTGDYGFREVSLTVAAVAADGGQLQQWRHTFVKELKTALPPGGRWSRTFPLPPGAVRAIARLERTGGARGRLTLREAAMPLPARNKTP